MTPVKSVVAATVVAGVAASSAHALDVSQYTSDNAHGRIANVFIGGSRTVNLALWQSATHEPAEGAALCDSSIGTIDVYSDAADAQNPRAQLFIFCAARRFISGLSRPEIAIFKESTLGSQNGSLALIANAKAGAGSNKLPFVNAALMADSACDAGVPGIFVDAQPYTFHGNCSFPTNIPAVNITGGVSDVEATLLGASAADTNTYLQGSTGYAVVYAIAVNMSFYHMLQTGEGLMGNGAAGVPSLTHAQLAAIYSQNLADPGQILGITGNPIVTPRTWVIGICRREFGSGEEASAELFWLGEGCGGSDLAIPSDDGVNVFQQTSTANVAGCLMAMDSGAAIFDAFESGQQPSGGPGRPGIGIISSENNSSTFFLGSTIGVGVLAVDGALPTLENVVNGSYPFFSEDVLYTIKHPPNFVDSEAAAVFSAIEVIIGSPGFLWSVNKAYVNYWGQSGDLSPPTIYGPPMTFPATASSVRVSPINALTKSSVETGSPNNCDPAVIYAPANAVVTQNHEND